MNSGWKTWTLLALLGTPALAQTNYLIEAKILAMDTDQKIALTGDQMTVHTNGDWRMLIEPGKSADSMIAKLEKQKGVDVLSAPRLMTVAGQLATIEISQSMRYLVPLSNDLYRAVTLPQESNPGVHLSVIVTPVATATNRVKLDLKLRSNLIEEQLDLEGFPGHKLGEPVISSRSMATVVETPVDGWTVVGGNRLEHVKGRASEMLVVLVRVSAPPPDSGTDSKGARPQPDPVAK